MAAVGRSLTCVVLGVYAMVGDWRLASAAAVAALGLLAFRALLHRWLKALSWEELRSALILLAMTFVVLPLLPDQDMGPYGVFNPYQLWMLTILIGGVSYLGYIAIRVFGAGRGMPLAAAIGAAPRYRVHHIDVMGPGGVDEAGHVGNHPPGGLGNSRKGRSLTQDADLAIVDHHRRVLGADQVSDVEGHGFLRSNRSARTEDGRRADAVGRLDSFT